MIPGWQKAQQIFGPSYSNSWLNYSDSLVTFNASVEEKLENEDLKYFPKQLSISNNTEIRFNFSNQNLVSLENFPKISATTSCSILIRLNHSNSLRSIDDLMIESYHKDENSSRNYPFIGISAIISFQYTHDQV